VRRPPGAGLVDRVRGRTGRAPDPGTELALLDGIAAGLEAGLLTHRAVELAVASLTGPQAGPAGHPWRELTRAAELGQPLAPVWARLGRRTGSPTCAAVARAWWVASATGAPLAGAVRAGATAARERRRLVRAVEVATAGARAMATVLTVLPVAGVGLAALLGIDPLTLYATGPALASAVAGACLVGVGRLVVTRMVRGVVRGVL
jgi:tight adherence protein B